MRQFFLNKRNLLKILITIILISLNVSVFLIVRNCNKPDSNDDKTEPSLVSINMILIDRNSVVIFDEIREVEDKECIYDVLIKYHEVKSTDSGYGKVILDIDTVKTKFYSENYIAIYVNDTYSSYGISNIFAEEGMKITFKEVIL